MSEKLLPSSSASTPVKRPLTETVWFYLFALVGVLVAVYGAYDLSTRVHTAQLSGDWSYEAFAPAAALFLPQSGSATATSSSNYNASTTAVGPITPASLVIPSIGIKATVEPVGKKADGSMGTPQKFDDVGWFSLGAKPGEAGKAVFDGHVNNALMKPGVFEHLSLLKVGDPVIVYDSAGRSIAYRVTRREDYPANLEETSSFFATTGPSGLVLITCEGEWVESQRSFSQRLVVFAQPL
jgi:sortase (surface protein transpeptidase)